MARLRSLKAQQDEIVGGLRSACNLRDSVALQSALDAAAASGVSGSSPCVLEALAMREQLGREQQQAQQQQALESSNEDARLRRREAIRVLEIAIASRSVAEIDKALWLNVQAGNTVGPEVDEAHRVSLEIKQAGAVAALNAVLQRPALTDEHFAELLHAIETADGFGVVVTQARQWLEKLQDDRRRVLREQEEEGRRQSEAKVERIKAIQTLEELMRGTPSVPALRRAIDAAERHGLGGDDEASACVLRARYLLRQMNQGHADASLQKVRDDVVVDGFVTHTITPLHMSLHILSHTLPCTY